MRIRLKDAFDLQMGKTPARNTPSYWDGDHKWISIADIGSAGKYIATTKERITDKAITESGIRAVPAHTVIMSFKLSIGKTAITSEEMYTNEAIMAFVSKGTYDIDADYLYHLCCGTEWTEGTNKAVMGLTLNKATLSEKRISLPEITEQRNIAAKFDALDNVIEKTQSELSSLDQLVKSRFVEMFGENVPTVQLGSVCQMINGDRGKNYPSGEDFVPMGVPFVNAGHLQEGRVDFSSMNYITEEKYALLSQGKMRRNDILYCLRGSLGKHGLVDFERGAVASSLVILRCNDQRILPQFLFYAIETPEIEKQLKAANNGSSQPNLSAASVKAYNIKLPSINKQAEFAAFVAEVDKSKFRIQKSLSTSRKLWTMAQIDAIMNMDFSTQRSL